MTSATVADSSQVQTRAFLTERFVWLWAETILPRLPVPAWVACVALAAALYLMGAGVALAFGELRAYVRDPHWAASFPTTGMIALFVVQMPQEIERLLLRLAPSLANSPADLAALRQRMRRALTRFVGPSVIIWLGINLTFVLGNPWGHRYEERELARVITVIYAPFVGYFYPIGFAFGIAGVAAAIREITRSLDFAPGFLLTGGRAALKPFAHFIWLWALHLLGLMILLSISNTPLSGEDFLWTDVGIWLAAAPIWLIILYCERSIDSMLAREKTSELRDLREALEREQDLPPNAEGVDVLRSMHRTQTLLYKLQRTESASTSIVDLRFGFQIALSVTAALLANVILRTAIAGLLD